MVAGVSPVMSWTQVPQSHGTWSPSQQWTRANLSYSSGLVDQTADLNIWSSLPLSFDSSEDSHHDLGGLFEVGPGAGVEEPVQAPELVILLVPGNPGLVDFYQTFLTRLFNDLQSNSISTVVISSSHLSHRTPPPASSRDAIGEFTSSLRVLISNLKTNWLRGILRRDNNEDEGVHLNEQVDYHCKLFEKVYWSINNPKSHGKPKFVLIGHSVGAYIATKIMDRNETKVDHFIGLFPTISEIGKSKNAARLKPLFAPLSLPFINLAQLVLTVAVPRWMLIEILRRGAGFFTFSSKKLPTRPTGRERFNSSIMAQLVVDAQALTNVLQMARSEMRTIKSLDVEFFKKFRSKLTLYYTRAEKDHWIEESEISKISDLLQVSPPTSASASSPSHSHSAEAIENEKASPLKESTESATPESGEPFGKLIRSAEDIPHAFCLDHSDVMAAHCSHWIQRVLKS